MRLALIALLLICTSTIVTAQPTTARSISELANQEIVTRVYDISDLLWRKTDYPAEEQNGAKRVTVIYGADGRPVPEEVKTPSMIVDSLMKLLTDTVAADTWKDNGGAIGSMRELSGQLIVSQIPENQRKIDEVLHALRADRGRMVVVRAYWVLLDASTVLNLAPKASNGNELQIIDANLIDAKNLYCGAQTTCFSGQTVHVKSGKQRSMVTNLMPVVGTGAVGFNPTVDVLRSGVVLEVTPHLEPEGPDARVVLDLKSTVTDLGDAKEKIQMPTTQPGDATGSIDRINGTDQEMRTTVRLPLGKKVLIGGMTLVPVPDSDGKQLHLVVEADAVK